MVGKCMLPVLLALMPTLLQAAGVESYSLTQLSTGPGDGRKAMTKWFVTPLKSRTEMAPDASDPAASVIVITRRDRGLAWTLFPTKKVYLERALDERELRRLGERFKADLTVEDLGGERILDHDCRKQRVDGVVKLGSRTVKSVQTVWQCEDFDVPLRIDGENGARTRTTDLRIGPQPDTLFQVPGGYTKAGSPMDVMRSGGGH